MTNKPGVEKLSYDKSWSHHAHQHEMLFELGVGRIASALPLVGVGEHLLDVGCGDGAFAVLIKDRFREVHGVDISGVALERAACAGVITQRANLDEDPLPYGDGAFDCVTCLDVIEHVYDPRHLLNECHRVVQPGGTFIVSTVNIRYARYLLTLLFGGRFPRTSRDRTMYDGGHLHYFTCRDLQALIREQGFRLLNTRGVLSTKRLRWLRPFVHVSLVREFLSAGVIVKARK